MSSGRLAGLPDGRLRRRVGQGLLAGLILVVGVGQLLQDSLSYCPDVVHQDTGRFGSRPLRYGSYGLYLARTPPRVERVRVVMVGNSVYQGCGVVERMQAMANGQGRSVQLVNWSLTGAGLLDALVVVARAAADKPDLVVVCYNNLAGTVDRASAGVLPRFRTDCDQMLFEPAVARRLPWSFYARELDARRAADALLSTVFKVKRLDWLLRRRADDALATLSPGLVAALRRHLPLPTLNLVSDWLGRSPTGPGPVGEARRPMPELDDILAELAVVAEAADLPVVLLR